MRRKRVHGRRHHSTRPAPIGIKVDCYRDVAFADRAAESLIVQRNRPLVENGLRAFATLRTIGHLASGDPVPRIAKLTAHRELASWRRGFRFHSILSTYRVS